MNFQQYDFTIAANGSQRIDATGTFLMLTSSTGLVKVRLDNGTAVDLLPGRGLKLDPKDAFNYFTISDRTGAANVGLVLAGDDNLIDNRVTGEVSIIDGGKSRTIANSSFCQWNIASALAANFTHNQLWNPAGSGKSLIVESVKTVSTVSPGFVHQFSAVALTTLNGYGFAKKSGGSASVAQLRQQAMGAPLGGGGIGFALTNATTGLTDTFRPVEPIVVTPGWGYVVNGQSINSDVSCTFEWFEE